MTEEGQETPAEVSIGGGAPPGGGGGAPPGGALPLNVASAPESIPPPPPPPTPTPWSFQFGFNLAQRLLLIIAGSIAGLLMYLWCMDYSLSIRAEGLAERAMPAFFDRTSSPDLPRLNALVGTLDSLITDQAAHLSVAQIKNASDTISTIMQQTSISQDQKEQLSGCSKIITDSADSKAPVDLTTVRNCRTMISGISSYSTPNSISPDSIRAAQDYIKGIQDAHQAFRSFWLQAAQLILLNLLLPILTALLGYLFGSQQQNKGQP